MLYILATPIGHLDDITLRAIRALKECDLIFCEDTRKTKFLLKHLEIDNPLYSFHKFNEKEKEKAILDQLEQGKTIGLVSDAGTPLINDPGGSLVKKAFEMGYPVTSIPGACSVINALVLSGLDSASFQFGGFLEKKEGEKERQLKKALCFSGTSIFFETPHRLIKTLKLLHQLDPERTLVVLREMTKKFEERVKGTPQELIQHFQEVKGEIVLCIEKKDFCFEGALSDIIELLIKEHGLSMKDAITQAAKLTKKSKKDVYRYVHHPDSSSP